MTADCPHCGNRKTLHRGGKFPGEYYFYCPECGYGKEYTALVDREGQPMLGLSGTMVYTTYTRMYRIGERNGIHETISGAEQE